MRLYTGSLIGMLALLLGSGCSTRTVAPEPRPPPATQAAKQTSDIPYERNDISVDITSDELLRFGANLAQAPLAERKSICRDLLKRERARADLGLELHLMVGRTLSRSCGDVATVLKWVSAIPSDRIPEDRLRWLIARDSAVLKEMQRLGRATSQVSRTRKVSRAQCPPAQPQQEETVKLRQKLEEIRAIERQLDGEEARD
jgi:hypothetical protein